MSGDWNCYGWSGTYCHTGTNFFASESDGLCFKNTDQDYIPENYPFDIYFAAHHVCTSSTLNRKIVEFFNGEAFYSFDVENNWEHVYDQLTISSKSGEGLYTFQLQDGDGNVLCEKSVNLGEETIEPEPPLPGEEDYTDYAKIETIVTNSDNLINLNLNKKVNIAITGIGAGVAEMSHELASAKTEIKDNIETTNTNITNLSTNIFGLFRVPNGTISDWIKDIKTNVDNITFPDLSGLTTSIDNVKDSLNNVVFPDLTGLATTLDNVKTSFENLNIPSLTDIGHLKDNIINHIDSKLALSLTSLQAGFTRVGTAIENIPVPDLTFITDGFTSVETAIENIPVPDLSFITDDFTSVESKISNLKIPSITDIKIEFENAATSVATAIINHIIDEIEKRYNP